MLVVLSVASEVVFDKHTNNHYRDLDMLDYVHILVGVSPQMDLICYSITPGTSKTDPLVFVLLT
jgi:hypothetical protein